MSRARSATLAFAFYAAGCATRPAPEPSPALLPSGAGERPVAVLTASPPPPKVDLGIDIPDHRSVRDALNYFTTALRQDIQQSLVRSAHYKKLIDRILDEYNLPKGLAYLPVIESAYLPTLTSRAGAHGIWQFMPETAREYGLRVDWWIDERADPDRSTRAAIAYLKDLYREFHDWPLALAAYNAGPGRIHRALDATGATTFWRLLEMTAIPRETRGYVPTFFATLRIASDPELYGFQLANPIDMDVKHLEVEGPLSLRFIAAATDVDEGILRDLNPALRRGVVPPGKATIRVPRTVIEVVLNNNDPNVAICSYSVREGDSLKKLARAIGADSETIVAMNGLAPKARLHRGDAIYLPVRARDLGNLLAGHRKARPGEHPLTGGGM